MKKIPIINNKNETIGYAKCSDCDFEMLSKYKWHKGNRYAVTSVRKDAGDSYKGYNFLYMHRMVTNCPKNMCVDHKNDDCLDNRKENLRICTQSDNAGNKKSKGTTSKYKGVSKKGDKWIAYVSVNGKTEWYKGFTNEKQAALKYNEISAKVWGKFARLNKFKID